MRILIPIMLLSLSLCAHAASPRGVSFDPSNTNVLQTVHVRVHSVTNLSATASTVAGYDANKKLGSLTAADVRTLLSVPIFDLTDPGAANIFPFWDDAQNEVDWTSNTALLTLLGIDSNDNVTFGTVTATTVTATTLAGGGAGITYDGSGNNGNLATSINTLQELNDAVDNLSLGGGGGVSDGDKGDIVISGTGTVYTIDANSVALGTDSTGNYAAGDGEAGAALTGDSATGFFPAGTLELARGGTGASLSDPNADRLMFWDDSAGVIAFLTLGTSLTITGTTIDASGASAPTGTMVNSGASTQYAIPYYADTSGTNMVPSLITTDATKTNLNAGSVSAGDLILTNVATSLSNIGLGTEDSPQFTGIELGHATQNTLTASGGTLSVEGVELAKRTGGNTLGGAQLLSEGGSITLDAVGSADGAWSGIARAGTAGATLAFGDLVVLDATDSRWELADANSASGADGDSRGIIGICVAAAASDGTATTILLKGVVRADAVFPTFTINGPIYISETAGDITQTSPTTEDNVVRILGAAWTADEIYFNPTGVWTVYDAP